MAGMKGILVPLETMEIWLKEQGVIPIDAKVLRMQDVIMQNSIVVVAEHERFPDLEPGSPIASETFSKSAVAQKLEDDVEGRKPKGGRRAAEA